MGASGARRGRDAIRRALRALLVRRAVGRARRLALVTVVLVIGLGRLRTEFDVEKSLPAIIPSCASTVPSASIRGRNTIIVAIVPRDGGAWNPDVLRVVADVTRAALDLPG